MHRRNAALIAASFACAVAAAIIYLAAVHVHVVQRADLRLLSGFVDLSGPHSYRAATALVQLFDPVPFAVLACAVAAIGIARRRLRLGLAAGAAMLAANVTTQLLKPALATPRPNVAGSHVLAAAWPSGHATAVISLALAIVLVCPGRLRPAAAAAGGLLSAAVAGAILLLGWHYPSDVAGGFLVALGWTCLFAAAALTTLSGSDRVPRAAQTRRPQRSARARG